MLETHQTTAGPDTSLLPKVTVCIVVYGNYPHLTRRVVESVRTQCPRSSYEMVIGANAVCRETQDYLEAGVAAGEIDQLILSSKNLNKNPMMRLVFEKVRTEFIMWFDDDSYILESNALERWLTIAESDPATTVQWGQMAWCDRESAFIDGVDAVSFVRSADWYRGLPPPSWRPGGKGEMDFNGQGTGDGRWLFLLGGCSMMRTRAMRELDWPDRRLVKLGEDVFLGEAIRQQGWTQANIGMPGMALDTEPRRGDIGLLAHHDKIQSPLMFSNES